MRDQDAVILLARSAGQDLLTLPRTWLEAHGQKILTAAARQQDDALLTLPHVLFQRPQDPRPHVAGGVAEEMLTRGGVRTEEVGEAQAALARVAGAAGRH